MYRGNRLYRDIRYREFAAGGPPPPPVFADLPERYGFRLEFFNAAGELIGLLGSDIQYNIVLRVEFSVEEFGPGEFRMELSEEPGFEIDYRTRVQVRPFFDQGDPWGTYYIKTLPLETAPGDPLVYEGYGYYDQLSHILVSGTWAGVDTGALFGQVILNLVAPNTDILYNAVRIGNTGWNETEMTWDYHEATETGEDLSKLSGNFVFGVNENREAFFKQIVTTAQNHWWEGIHFAKTTIKKDSGKLINRVYVKGGEVDAGGSNILSIRSDIPSIATHGLHEDVIMFPSAMDAADADAFGDLQLAMFAEPRQVGTVARLDLTRLENRRPVTINGAARITMAKR